MLWFSICIVTHANAQDAGEIMPHSANYNKNKNYIDSVRSTDSLPHTLTIRNIVIEGNKRTRRIIILRELTFKTGDSIALHDIPRLFEEAKNRLMNTALFHEDETNISVAKFDREYIDVKVNVNERWYWFAFPHLKPVDRNMSQWLFKERASLARVDYGVKIMLDNITGNNDNLRFYFVNGYTRQLQLSYRRPFIDKNLKWGINFDVAFGKNHEINFITIDDKQQFLELKDEKFARNFFQSELAFTYRPAFYSWHTFGLRYNHLKVHNAILQANPRYFKTPGSNDVRYPELYYKFTYRNFDYNPYPHKGHAAEIMMDRMGLGKDVDVWQLTTKAIKYWPIDKKTFYSVGIGGTIKLPFDQPYYTSQLLGYGDAFLRGYEYYVMDGVAGALVNATLARQLTNFSIHIPAMKWLNPRLIPLRIYGKVYGNAGCAYNPEPGNNRLNNKMLFGGGFGFDVVTMYDFNLKIEFSFNQLGEKGLYLQKKSMFQ